MEQQDQCQGSLYSTLDPESRQIRLFTFLSGGFDDPIKGYLTQVLLDDELNYETLSYVWRDPTVSLFQSLLEGVGSMAHHILSLG
jgi:hypothetical protein